MSHVKLCTSYQSNMAADVEDQGVQGADDQTETADDQTAREESCVLSYVDDFT